MHTRTALLPGALLLGISLLVLAAGPVARAGAPAALPPAVDLSRTPHFPALRDQGAIGSCDWFAVVHYQMTFMVNERLKRAATPETTFSPQFGYNLLNNGGPFPHDLRVDDVYRFVTAHGAATLAQVPYDGDYLPWVTDAAIWEAALRHRIAGYRTFTLRDAYTLADDSFDTDAEFLHEIKRLLAAREVLVVQSFTPSVKAGTIGDDPATDRDDALAGQHIIVQGNPGPDHTLAVVGYDDGVWVDANGDGEVQADEKGALKLADSLSPAAPPHNAGFLWMAYRTVTSSVFQNRVNRMLLREAYAPRVVARVTLRSAQRDRLHVQVGRARAATPEAAAAGAVFDPYGLGFAAGIAGTSLTAGPGCSFDGGKDEREGSFAFDLTELAGRDRRGVWFLRLRNEGTRPATVVRFEVVDLATGESVVDAGLPETVETGELLCFAEASGK